jgi:hypothetical protein
LVENAGDPEGGDFVVRVGFVPSEEMLLDEELANDTAVETWERFSE